ncbi:MAG: 30S ribosomal protein S2 [Omnitrophica bacterium RIFCSPHIGHO2_02_FULL_51_18]|nr:MAG: 30S ribosomal protein S2 [Omnitrophica bacterium RIFCSPHIGHO2_02_FULL_51_18]
MSKELIQNLLEAGVHFGHQTKKWNPKMKPYIFGEKNGIYIIDLEKTSEHLERACKFIHDVAAKGETILFVGTKPQAQAIIESEAKRCGMYFVSHRWLGGMLTNYQTIRNSINRYRNLLQMRGDGTFDALTKKEVAELEKEITKLEKNLAGIVNMKKLPGALFVIDAKKETIAIKEANRLNIAVVSIVDTDSDPNTVQYPIPGNDDAIRSIKLITGIIVDSVIEGLQKVKRNTQQTGDVESEGAGGDSEAVLSETKEQKE